MNIRPLQKLLFVVAALTISILASAQPMADHPLLGGRILVVNSSGQPWIDTLLPRFTSEPIDILDSIPLQLSQYDAVFYLDRGNDTAIGKRTDLIDYATSGGAIYCESYVFFRGLHDYEPFWDFVGDSGEAETELLFYVDSLKGRDGTFTAGISKGIPFDLQHGMGYLERRGNLKPVLSAIPYGGGPEYEGATAWIPADSTLKIVLHSNLGWFDYYDDFIHRVVCQQFNLCAAGVAERSEAAQDIRWLAASQNPFNSSTNAQFILNTDQTVSIECFDVLGQSVWSGGTHRYASGIQTISVTPPSNITGTLYLRLASASGEVRSIKLIKER